ncbi:hypothetical protein BGZ61DRAFT_147007 [Ilyonectria robusta]|uniref:uncharacterized protein n=1 Tax=Ilyonectria robusta TaxID=1079257 RepID=UPI001E8CA442|nr:uncharacterized protein BGZ61DRAFT_147007 [Ilyonectria robusta]KAH8662803.1 hypothetical protein BGZ61DRAFT_147007 [Ilyonectria robusta]
MSLGSRAQNLKTGLSHGHHPHVPQATMSLCPQGSNVAQSLRSLRLILTFPPGRHHRVLTYFIPNAWNLLSKERAIVYDADRPRHGDQGIRTCQSSFVSTLGSSTKRIFLARCLRLRNGFHRQDSKLTLHWRGKSKRVDQAFKLPFFSASTT